MLLKTLAGKLFYKFFVLLISALYSFAPYTAPSAETPIAPQGDSEPQMYFAALADPQVSNYILKRIPFFDAACEDLHNAAYPMDAVLIAGDVAENGLAIEYEYIYQHLSGIDTQYIMEEGNHDIRLRLYQQSLSRFSAFSNALNGDDVIDSYHFSTVVNGYKFIVVGSDRTEFEEKYISDEQLAWIDSELAAEDGHPTFVVCHQPLKDTHGLPETWGSPFKWTGTVGAQSAKLDAILQKYDNVILISGHLHTGLGEFTYEEHGNIHMVNLPSLCIKCKDGADNGPGLGCMVECYEDQIVLRGRNFSTGEWLPQFDHAFPVK